MALFFGSKKKKNKNFQEVQEVQESGIGDELFVGYVENVTATKISGWCVHKLVQDAPVELQLLVDDTLVAECISLHLRHDVMSTFPRAMYAGFAFHIGSEVAKNMLIAFGDRDKEAVVEVIVQVKDTNVVIPSRDKVSTKITLADLKLVADGNYFKSRDPFYVRFERIKAADRSHEPKSLSKHGVKLIAYYLPQFHPFPENNEWWGEGFTEWTNVTKAKPQFSEHYQPHLPADLGFYDLRLSEIRERQAELAREYGIYGFCYHYYWFAGRTLMDLPIRAMLESGKPDFPFCICWANEPWSRRWDGSESEVLLSQPHELDTDERFIVDVMPYLKDPRYIRVNNAPLIIIYRIGLLPDPMELFRRWRLIAAEHGVTDLHIVMAETFGSKNPYSYGCEASVGFPPHGVAAPDLTKETILDEESEFSGKIYDYRDVACAEMAKSKPEYPHYPAIMPSWDNSARRGHAGHIFKNASPEFYEIWLRALVDSAKAQLALEQRFVFVNAWNEWAEGAHLEPDRKHGRQYLEATRRALTGQCSLESAMLELESMASILGEGRLDNIRQAISNEIGGLRRANAYMEKRYSEIYDDANVKRSAWRQSLGVDLRQIEWSGAAIKFNLDRVNQYSSSNMPLELVLDRQCWLDLYGWLFVNHWAGNATHLYVMAEGINGIHIALVRQRFERADVSNAFSQQVRMPAGFEVALPLEDLGPGKFNLNLIATDGSVWYGVHCPMQLQVI